MLQNPPADTSATATNWQKTLEIARDRLLTRKEAARYLGVAPQTLAAWACTGRYSLPYVKIGRRVFYRKADLDAFIERHRVA